MKLLGEANWWMPAWLETVLRLPHPEPIVVVGDVAPEPVVG
jgi:hypothetical protein